MKVAMRMILGVLAASLAAAPAIADDAIDGKKVWDKSCKGCHTMMAPKATDKAAWAPFVTMGTDAVTASVMKGKGTMPPKGGAKTEADVKAAVEYILGTMK